MNAFQSFHWHNDTWSDTYDNRLHLIMSKLKVPWQWKSWMITKTNSIHSVSHQNLAFLTCKQWYYSHTSHVYESQHGNMMLWALKHTQQKGSCMCALTLSHVSKQEGKFILQWDRHIVWTMWNEMNKKYKQAYVRQTTLTIGGKCRYTRKRWGYGMTYV